MEGMAAQRELMNLLTDSELKEADGIIGELGSQFMSEGKLWKRAEDLFVKALIRWRRQWSV